MHKLPSLSTQHGYSSLSRFSAVAALSLLSGCSLLFDVGLDAPCVEDEVLCDGNTLTQCINGLVAKIDCGVAVCDAANAVCDSCGNNIIEPNEICFVSPPDITAVDTPHAITFAADGQSVGVLSKTGESLVVFSIANDGSLTENQRVNFQDPTIAVATEELNGDTFADWVVTNENSRLQIITSNPADGSLTATQAIFNAIFDIQLVNFNADDFFDIAASRTDGNIVISAQTAPNIFSQPASINIGNVSPQQFTSVDMDSPPDGTPELVFSEDDSQDLKTFRFANNDFAETSSCVVGDMRSNAIVANLRNTILATEVDGDDRPDLLVNVPGESALKMIRGGVAEDCQSPQVLSLPGSALDMVSLDFDGDGDLDLVLPVVANDGQGDRLLFLENDGSGSFSQRASIPAPDGPVSIDSRDINGDDIADFVVASFASNSIRIYLSNP